MNFFMLFMTLIVASPAFSKETAIYEYKEILRTYTDLSTVDLAGCKTSFRFLNSNWMDCEFILPAPGLVSPVQQITPTNYPVAELTLKTGLKNKEFYFRLESIASSYEEAAGSTRMLINAYYQTPGQSEISQVDPANYSYKVFKDRTALALKKIGKQRTLTSTMIIALDPSLTSTTTQDKILGSIYLAKNLQTTDLEKCKETYKADMLDNWPEPRIQWNSGCFVKTGSDREFLSMEKFWSPELAKLKYESRTQINFPEFSKDGQTPFVQIHSSPGSYGVYLGTLVNNQRNFNVNIDYGQAEKFIKAAFLKVRKLETYFILRESKLKSLGSSDTVVGKLILRRENKQDTIDLSPR